MLKRYLSRLLCGVWAVATLTSCGDSKSSGTGEFSTVFATATAPAVAAVEADVAHWVLASTGTGTGPACGANSMLTIPAANDVAFNITSTPFASPGTGQTNPSPASPLVITRVNLTLVPANSDTPALPALFQNQPNLTAGQTILPGTTQSVSVRLANQELKEFLLDPSRGALAISCSNNPIYSYLATVTFEAREVNTDRTATIAVPGSVLLKLSDFTDQ